MRLAVRQRQTPDTDNKALRWHGIARADVRYDAPAVRQIWRTLLEAIGRDYPESGLAHPGDPENSNTQIPECPHLVRGDDADWQRVRDWYNTIGEPILRWGKKELATYLGRSYGTVRNKI
jgi:hypothetical protein